MSRSLLLSLLTYGLLLAGIILLQGEFIALALPLVSYLLVGYLQTPDKPALEATRQLSIERAAPDQDVEVTVTVTNHGPSIEEVLINDLVPHGLTVRLKSSRHLVRLASGDSFTFAYTVSGPRGGYLFHGLDGRLFVFPPVMRLRHIAIRPRRTRVYAGTIPARAGGPGAEFFGVREYQPGDPPHSINWRASARSMEALYANEYQQERVADVGIVVDGRFKTNEFARGHSIFDHSVQAAASMADALLNQGNRVGLLLYASYLGWTLPGYGRMQRERILHALANARTGDSQVFSDLEHIPTRLFPPESQIIFISPLIDEDLKPLIQLRAQGYDVMVVSPNPVRFELSYLGTSNLNVELAGRVLHMERVLLLQRLQRANIQVLDWDIKEPFDLLVKRKLSHAPAWLRAIGR
jgi:uncharacterized repeat protein (TIGR01451 family)